MSKISNEQNVLPFPSQQNLSSSETDNSIEEKDSLLKQRFYAFFTDLFFIGLIQKAFVATYLIFINDSFLGGRTNLQEILSSNLFELRLSTLYFTFFSYFFTSLYFCNGKTLGKTFFNLKVVSSSDSGRRHISDEELSLMDAFMRTMGYSTCYLAYAIPFCLVFLRSDQRGIPDIISQTEVILDPEFKEGLNTFETLQEEEGEKKIQLDLFVS